MTKATEKTLAELHGKLAISMMRALEESEQAQVLLDIYLEELPDEVADFLREKAQDNPSLLTAIGKFLKDNKITCAAEDSDELNELAETLRNKRGRRTVGNVVPFNENE